MRKDSTHPDGFVITHWDSISLSPRDNASLSDVVDQLFHHDRSDLLLHAEWYVIEQQSLRNAWCYGFAHVLKMYLRFTQPAANIRIMSPLLKFRVLEPNAGKAGNARTKSSHRNRKQWAIRMCEQLLGRGSLGSQESEESRRAIHRFSECQKRDDLADAFLCAYVLIRQTSMKRKRCTD